MCSVILVIAGLFGLFAILIGGDIAPIFYFPVLVALIGGLLLMPQEFQKAKKESEEYKKEKCPQCGKTGGMHKASIQVPIDTSPPRSSSAIQRNIEEGNTSPDYTFRPGVKCKFCYYSRHW